MSTMNSVDVQLLRHSVQDEGWRCSSAYLTCEPLLQDGVEPGETGDPGQNVSSKGLGKR